MKKILKSIWLVTMIFSTSAYAIDADFSLHSNGVTILCPDATVGDSGVVGDVTYTKISSKTDVSEAYQSNGSINAENACTSGVTSMYMWFYDKDEFNKDISHWDTSSVTTMSSIFQATTVFNQDIGKWNTSNVPEMYNIML